MKYEELPTLKRFKCRDRRTGAYHRAMKETNGDVFVFMARRRLYGYRMEEDAFLRLYEYIPSEDPERKWKRDVKRAVSCLEKSGLWPELLVVFRNLQNVTLSDRNAVRSLYRDSAMRKDTEEYSKALAPYAKKYPFMFTAIDPPGSSYTVYAADTAYLYEMSDCRLKPMYFGKWQNADEKERIKEALSKKEAYYSGRIHAGYDVSFQYDPKAGKAWYSEEYRNCGNGHYYIAIDGNTALFVEDD